MFRKRAKVEWSNWQMLSNSNMKQKKYVEE